MQGKRSSYKPQEIFTANQAQGEALRHSPEYKSFYEKVQRNWSDPKKQRALERKALNDFGINFLLLRMQGYDNFFSPDEEWPTNTIFFPEYFEYLQTSVTVEGKVYQYNGRCDIEKDKSFISPFFEPSAEASLKDKCPPISIFKEVLSIGKNRPVRIKEREKGSMRKAPVKMLQGFKYLDHYIAANVGRDPLDPDREGYGRTAKYFGVKSGAVKQGINRAREAIKLAVKGYLLYPILAGPRPIMEASFWHEELEEAEKQVKKSRILTPEQKKQRKRIEEKLREHKKKIDEINTRVLREEGIDKKKLEKTFEPFLKSLDDSVVSSLRNQKGMRFLKIKK